MTARPKVLGTCTACGRKVFGTRARLVNSLYYSTKGGAIRDINGLRHADCRTRGPGYGSGAGVTPSDA